MNENKNQSEKKLFYSLTTKSCKIECFKLPDRNELIEPGYEVVCTNLETGESDLVEGYSPQSCIALADEVMKGLQQ